MADRVASEAWEYLELALRGRGMSCGRGELHKGGDVLDRGSVAAAAVNGHEASARTLRDALCEIDTLRSINGRLMRQVAELTEREAQAQQQADRDGLTGLFNRRKLGELLEAAVAAALPHGQRVGVLFIDLDGFKGVNDAHGHSVGDKLLATVASRIAARARTGDYVCRYGGDEFVVILPRLADMAAALQVADSIRNRVALPYRIDGAELRVTAAIGAAIYPDQAASSVELLELADESMYRVKMHAEDSLRAVPPMPAQTRRRDDKMKRRTLS
jgi:diguanylate cyclase (GGDEF)-like protein